MHTETAEATKNDSFVLKIIKTKSEYLNSAFGISDQRRDELCEVIEEEFKKVSKEDISDAMQNISKRVGSHEELAWSMFVFGCYVADARNNPLASLLAALGSSN